jgi:hypothetical protein
MKRTLFLTGTCLAVAVGLKFLPVCLAADIATPFVVTRGVLSSEIRDYDSVDLVICIENQSNKKQEIDLYSFYPFDHKVFVNGKQIVPSPLKDGQVLTYRRPSERVTILPHRTYVWKTDLFLRDSESGPIPEGQCVVEFADQRFLAEKRLSSGQEAEPKTPLKSQKR